jgi:hypothetical protein
MSFEEGERVVTIYTLGESLMSGTRGTVVEFRYYSENDQKVIVDWDDGKHASVQADTIRKLDPVERIGELA